MSNRSIRVNTEVVHILALLKELMGVLTDEDVGKEGGRQAKNNDEHVSDGEVDNEIVGDVAHSGRAVDDGYDEHVADEPHDEDGYVGDAEDNGKGEGVPVELDGLLGRRQGDVGHGGRERHLRVVELRGAGQVPVAREELRDGVVEGPHQSRLPGQLLDALSEREALLVGALRLGPFQTARRLHLHEPRPRLQPRESVRRELGEARDKAPVLDHGSRLPGGLHVQGRRPPPGDAVAHPYLHAHIRRSRHCRSHPADTPRRRRLRIFRRSPTNSPKVIFL